MTALVVTIAVFVGVAALVGSMAIMVRGGGETKVEDRLEILTKGGGHGSAEDSALLRQGSLAEALAGQKNPIEEFFSQFGNLRLLFEQADTTMTMTKFLVMSLLFALAGCIVSLLAGLYFAMAPIVGMICGGFPLVWLLHRRKRRLKKFAAQMPEAMELIARALRSGHSLASAFDMVSHEMPEPIGKEFAQAYEEQNLGISLEEALESMTERVPNLDLKFFVTAIILQRQTGGDLAEILDKIGELIRDRYRIMGQVQALTGEGRLSGVVLLALPPVLFVAIWRINPDYATVLFTDPMGKKMLAGACLLMLLGALVIRKIVNIKV